MVATTSNSVMPFLGPDVQQPMMPHGWSSYPFPYEATTMIRRGCKMAQMRFWRRHKWNTTTRNWTGKLVVMLVYIYAAVADTRNQHMFHLRKCCKSPKKRCTSRQDGKFVIALGGRTQHYHWCSGSISALLDEPFTVIQMMPRRSPQ